MTVCAIDLDRIAQRFHNTVYALVGEKIMETNIKEKQYDEMMELLKDYFGHDQFTELYFGDKIQEGDVYVFECAKVVRATDVGSGSYTSHHWPHFRPASNITDEPCRHGEGR